jgi:metallophosphoesterase (TIGR00282 family)
VKILFIGDIVGSPGRDIVAQLLPKIQKDEELDFIIANAENAAGGIGLTPKVAEELFLYNIDVLTSGNHIWDKKEILEYIARQRRILRPCNYPPGVAGVGATVISRGNKKLGVLNLSGRVFMKNLDCPFRTALKEIEELKEKVKVIVVDMHAEATSEKIAMGWFLDGKVSAVFGTHTHVQTADERILPNGTAYITDIGMAGSRDSVIGVKKELILERFLTQMPLRQEVAKDDLLLQAVVADIDKETGRAVSIKRLSLSI